MLPRLKSRGLKKHSSFGCSRCNHTLKGVVFVKHLDIKIYKLNIIFSSNKVVNKVYILKKNDENMNKKAILFSIALCFAVIAISNVSASYWDYPDYYNSYEKNTYSHINNAYSTAYHPWGIEKKTSYTTQKTIIEKQYYPKYRSYSYWRYDIPHYFPNYYNTYTTPYYYAPIYDPHLGYYNWRY